jgi:sulfate permease, SulP family
VQEAIRAATTQTSWFVFDAEAVNHIDSTGVEALFDLSHDLRREQITLVVARLRARMMHDVEVAGLTEAIGPEHFYPTVRLAVEAFDNQRSAT